MGLFYSLPEASTDAETSEEPALHSEQIEPRPSTAMSEPERQYYAVYIDTQEHDEENRQPANIQTPPPKSAVCLRRV